MLWDRSLWNIWWQSLQRGVWESHGLVGRGSFRGKRIGSGGGTAEAFHFQEASSAFHPAARCFELKRDLKMSRINQPKWKSRSLSVIFALWILSLHVSLSFSYRKKTKTLKYIWAAAALLQMTAPNTETFLLFFLSRSGSLFPKCAFSWSPSTSSRPAALLKKRSSSCHISKCAT